MVNGELILLDHEVNPVITVALKSGLEVTALGTTLLFEQPRLLTLNVTGEGTFQTLGAAFWKALDEARRVRAQRRDASPRAGTTTALIPNAIDPSPLNTILSMRGVAADGIYRAAIGRVALVNGTPIGREMGMSTKVAIFGTNDRADVDVEMIVSARELQRVLMALRSKDLNITSIRNHLVGEHPPFIFVKSWGQGTAAGVAARLRFVLDVEVDPTRLPADWRQQRQTHLSTEDLPVFARVLLSVVALTGPAEISDDPTVVFACEHGAAKSVIATAYFIKIAAERGLRARAMYRGVNPQSDLSAAALKGVNDDGLMVPDQKPSAITQADVDTPTIIFAIGCTLPPDAPASGKGTIWDDVPDDQGYGPARGAIKDHVERLVDDLLKKQRLQ